MDSAIEKWKLWGAAHLWRYGVRRANEKGWHVAADTAGCASFGELMELIRVAKYPARVAVPVTKPSEAVLRVPNEKYMAAGVWSPQTLDLRCDPRSAGDVWAIDEARERVTFTFGIDWLGDLAQAFADMGDQRGDYSIGPDRSEQRIWVWWVP